MHFFNRRGAEVAYFEKTFCSMFSSFSRSENKFYLTNILNIVKKPGHNRVNYLLVNYGVVTRDNGRSNFVFKGNHRIITTSTTMDHYKYSDMLEYSCRQLN